MKSCRFASVKHFDMVLVLNTTPTIISLVCQEPYGNDFMNCKPVKIYDIQNNHLYLNIRVHTHTNDVTINVSAKF